MNIIQLKNGFVIIVDDIQFKKAKRKFLSFFCRFLTIVDVRGYKITIRKTNILLLEQHEKEKEIF